MDGPKDRMDQFEEQWREWASAEPRIDEDQIRKALPVRLPSRKRRPSRMVWLAAAACLVLALIGVRAFLINGAPVGPPQHPRGSAVVHQLDENVVLFISKDSEPVYILLAEGSAGKGDLS